MIHHSGRIEVICGSMFCGKTEELIRRVRRAIIARQSVQVFKPEIDDRYATDYVTSHSGQNIEAYPIEYSREILKLIAPSTTVIAVDEAQFLDLEIVPIVEQLAAKGLRVIVAGLDLDFRAEPFGAMPHLMALAEEVTKLRAICTICGEYACRSQRLVNGQPARYDDPIIVVGAQETYEARCRKHHSVPGSPMHTLVSHVTNVTSSVK
ncbi:MAG: thymidine kinase [Anaerolineae bacterium]|jgi:thymidine kinase|nr:thymidine kinase [Anaerolineae bacterium]